MSENNNAMSIWGHINELRKRLFKALIAMGITTIISFIVAEDILHLLAMPIGGIEKLLSIEVTENISVFMRVSLLSGFILALPVVLYQLLAFSFPGLTPSERKWVLLSIPFATILFLCGVIFTYFVMLPTAVPFLLEFLGITTTPRLSNYINFVTSLMFWVGVSFEAPLLVFILAKINLITAQTLIKQWRFAIVIIAVLSAVITPTGDPINMGLLMLPLFILYLLSILLARIAVKSNENNNENTEITAEQKKERKKISIFKKKKKKKNQ